MTCAALIIDFEIFSKGMEETTGLFRRQIAPHVPVFWTLTDERGDAPRPTANDGYYPFVDRLFIKSESDASLQNTTDIAGQKIIPAMKAMGITDVFVGGATYYGCVLGACMDLRDAGIRPFVVKSLTDFDYLPDEDHEEGAPDFAAQNFSIVGEAQALAILKVSRLPKFEL